MELPKGRIRPRVGRLPYLFALPFTAHWEGADRFELITAPPRQLGHLTRHDELDAACVPVLAARSLRRRYAPLGNLGFAAVGPVPVAVLAARLEIELLGSAAVGVSDQGATAVAALEVLLSHAYRVREPNIVPLSPDRFDLGAVLLVGDDAIEASRSPSAPFVHPYDLAGEWRNWTGGPLPLCRWIVRKSLPDEQKEELEALVRRSVTEVLKNPGPLLESHIVEHGLSCSVLDAEAWLRSCTYELGPAEERAGQHLYELHRELHRKVTSWRDLLG